MILLPDAITRCAFTSNGFIKKIPPGMPAGFFEIELRLFLIRVDFKQQVQRAEPKDSRDQGDQADKTDPANCAGGSEEEDQA